MELKILEQKENPLFNRTELKLELEAASTPNRIAIEKLLAEKFSTQTENINLKKIFGNFGSTTFTLIANIYKTKEDKEAVEQLSKKQAAKEPKTETPAQVQKTKPEETKPEEKKE